MHVRYGNSTIGLHLFQHTDINFLFLSNYRKVIRLHLMKALSRIDVVAAKVEIYP